MEQRTRPICPKCRSADTVPIVYGFPTPEAHRAVRAREAVLGGCLVSGHDPNWCCKACRHRWIDPETARRAALEEEAHRRLWGWFRSRSRGRDSSTGQSNTGDP